VDITPALRTDLAALSDGLNVASGDVEGTLHRLGADVRSAVESFLGLSMTVRTSVGSFRLTAREMSVQRREIVSSLLIPVPLHAGHNGGSELILYAGRIGAFVDMAADLSWSVGAGLSRFVLDQHRDFDFEADESGLTELSTINQAVGVLVRGGLTLGDAHTELSKRARLGHRELHLVAQDIVTVLSRLDPDGYVEFASSDVTAIAVEIALNFRCGEFSA